jgi:hypothetical protein
VLPTLQVCICSSALRGISYSPSGRFLVVRNAQGCVYILDSRVEFSPVCMIHHESDAATFNWPAHAHEVLVTGNSLLPRAPPHSSSSVMHVITRASLRGVAVYRVDAAMASWELVRIIHTQETPVSVILHPSMHYICIVAPTGTAEVVHLHTGRTRGVFVVGGGALCGLGARVGCAAYDSTGTLFAAVVNASAATDSKAPSGSQVRERCILGAAAQSGEQVGQGQDASCTAAQLSVHCAESGGLLMTQCMLPPVCSMAFLPLASALVCSCASGCIVVVRLGESMRAQPRAVAHGRLQDGGSVFDYWLEHPIDMQLSSQKRKHKSEALQNVLTRKLQAVIRRAIDPIGPCVHLARRLMPYLMRNATRRTLMPRIVLRSAVRMTLVRSRLSEWRDAVLSIQACMRRLVSHRVAEDVLLEPERMAVHSLMRRGDSDGNGTWDLCDRAVAATLVRTLVHACMWAEFDRAVGLVFVSRAVEIFGIGHVTADLEYALERMHLVVSCGAQRRRKLEAWEIEQVRALAHKVAAFVSVLRQHACDIQAFYRTFLPPDASPSVWVGEAGWMRGLGGDAAMRGTFREELHARGTKSLSEANGGYDEHKEGGVGAVFKAFAHELTLHAELQAAASAHCSIFSCAEKHSFASEHVRAYVDVSRGTVSQVVAEARMLLQQTYAVHGYAVSAMGGARQDQVRKWLATREGDWIGECIWLRLNAKGVIPARGTRVVTMRQVLLSCSATFLQTHHWFVNAGCTGAFDHQHLRTSALSIPTHFQYNTFCLPARRPQIDALTHAPIYGCAYSRMQATRNPSTHTRLASASQTCVAYSCKYILLR